MISGQPLRIPLTAGGAPRGRAAQWAPLPIAGACVAASLFLASTTASGQDRMPPIPAANMTEPQRQAAGELTPAGGTLPAYMVPLLRSPEVLKRTVGLGDYVVRGETRLSRKLTELVILLVVRHWSTSYMWTSHHPIALRAGLSAATVQAIEEGRRPDAMPNDERLIYDFCTELQQNQYVSDKTYADTVQLFGEQGVVDTIGLAGYYTLLAMTYNTSRLPAATGGVHLQPLPR